MHLRTLDRALFRDCLAQWPSGVTVVTTVDGTGRPAGFTATAFSALSMAPPLVLVCLNGQSSCRAAFDGSDGFAVHVLRADQRSVAERFARSGDRFRGLPHRPAHPGQPVVADALAALSCRTVDRLAGGDHVILIGEVTEVTLGAGEPLLYHARDYRRLAPERVTDRRAA
jgi:flavin reductase ActVB